MQEPKNPIYNHIEENAVDAILYKAKALKATAGDDLNLKEKALNSIAETISFINSDYMQEQYVNKVVKETQLFKAATLTNRVKAFTKDREEKIQELKENERIIPSWIDKEKFFTLGFDEKVGDLFTTGIYFHMGEKGAKQLTNFVIKPLIHVYSKDDSQNRRLTEVNNGKSKSVLEFPSKAFSSVDQFEQIVMNEGVFYLRDGFTKSHLNKLKSKYLMEYPKCFELKTLGWQPEGFWAFYNRIYKDSLMPFNEYGYTEVDGVNYLSMAASSIQSDVRAEDDVYKDDRFLQWSKPTIDFKQWSDMMMTAYAENGYNAVMYVFVTLFRDIVFALNSSCPHLYAYGPVGSGKSAFAESISNLFFKEMPFFNLNQGTDFAFFNRLERFRNCPVGFNEFDENAIKEEWFRAIKSAFDGEGREKGSMTRKKKTETQNISCTIILIGQFLSTKDDASVLSRTIPCQISSSTHTAQQTAAFQRLKAYEKVGLGGILVELMQHRGLVEKKYAEVYAAQFKKLSMAFEKERVKVKPRIQNNFCTMLTMRALLNDLVYFPFSYDDFFDIVKREIVKLSHLITESDSLAAFWKTMEFMSEQDMIVDGWDYKIEVKDEVPIILSRSERGEDGKDTKFIKFAEPKKLLFLRMTTIHPMYMTAIRQQTGKTGLNSETIATYMKDQDSFIGMIKSTSFKRKGDSKNSNAYVLDYDLLNLNLEKTSTPVGQDLTIEDEVRWRDAEIIDVLGVPKVKWEMEEDHSYTNAEGILVKKIISITCYSEDTTQIRRMTRGAKIKVKGKYTERTIGDKVRGEMIASDIELLSSLSAPTPVEETEQNTLPF